MSLGIRGANPIWLLDDLTGGLFDDTYYLFVLQNTLPYLPATVYHDPDLNVAWTNPIQFLANGTLPEDIFFQPDVVYRLEFRQGDTQNDPLIYEVNDYVAGSNDSASSLISNNQITNPQFSLINFVSPLTISGTDPDDTEIAPGWTLHLAGTGTATITQVPLNNSNENPSNAPYALELDLSGWDTEGVYLYQRFQGNGMLWANKTVSSTITARTQDSVESINAFLIDSNGTLLASVLPSTLVSGTFTEYTGFGILDATTNPDFPPAAYIDYRLALPSVVDIYISSIQLLVQELPIEPAFEQDSLERQIDHTFHYFKPQLEFKPIPSMLTGWDFPLNPRQFGTISPVTQTTPLYVMDQTIMQTATGSVAVTQNTATGGITLVNASALEAIYLLQYLSGAQAQKILGTPLSVNIQSWSSASNVTARVYLYRGSSSATFPSVTAGNTIGTIANTGLFTLTAANWTLIARGNLGQASGALAQVATNPEINDADIDLGFSGWEITDSTEIGNTNKFAIVVTYQIPTITTTLNLQSISVVPGDIPTRPAPMTLASTLLDCQYYYRTSFFPGVAPVSSKALNNGETLMGQFKGSSIGPGSLGMIVQWDNPMIIAPTPTMYTPVTTGNQIYNVTQATAWTDSAVQATDRSGFYVVGTTVSGSAIGDINALNWTANARLGN